MLEGGGSKVSGGFLAGLSKVCLGPGRLLEVFFTICLGFVWVPEGFWRVFQSLFMVFFWPGEFLEGLFRVVLGFFWARMIFGAFFLWLFQIRFTRWVAIRVTDRHLLFINKGKCTRSAYARALVPC